MNKRGAIAALPLRWVAAFGFSALGHAAIFIGTPTTTVEVPAIQFDRGPQVLQARLVAPPPVEAPPPPPVEVKVDEWIASDFAPRVVEALPPPPEETVTEIEEEPLDDMIKIVEDVLEEVLPEPVEEIIESIVEPIPEETSEAQVEDQPAAVTRDNTAEGLRTPQAVYSPAPSYPPLAHRRGWEGDVWVEVTLNRNGVPTDVRISESSGYRVLDESARRFVEREWRFEASPEDRPAFPVRIAFRQVDAGN